MQYDNIMILKRLISKKYPLYRTMMSNKYKSNGEYLEQKEFLVQDPEGYLLRFTHEQLINSENGGQLIKKFSICFRYGIDKFRLNKIAARWPAKAVAQRFSVFYNKKQWKASPKSSIVKSPQNNNQTGSTFPLPMKRIPPFRLVSKRFYDPNAPPCKAVF